MTFKHYIKSYQELGYISAAVALHLSSLDDAYLPLVEAIYAHPNQDIDKKAVNRVPDRNKLPLFLKRMFVNHKDEILKLLANQPTAITQLLSFSTKAAESAVFANPLLYEGFLSGMFDLETFLSINEEQSDGFTLLHSFLLEFHQANIDIMPTLNKLKVSLGASAQDLYQIASELIHNDEHKLAITRQLFESGGRYNLGHLPAILQAGSINNKTISQLMLRLNKSSKDSFDALVSFTKHLNRRLTVAEVCRFFNKKANNLVNLYLSSDYDTGIRKNAELKNFWFNYIADWLFSQVKDDGTESHRNTFNMDGFYRCWQFYHSVPDMILSVMKFFEKKKPAIEVNNLTSYPVFYFLFNESDDDPNDRFHNIVGITDVQRENFESCYVALLLKNKILTANQVLSMTIWQREYLEIWMSTQTNTSLEETRNFVLNLPTLEQAATEERIRQFFQQEYELDRDNIPLRQRKNISCAALRRFFRGQDKEQLLHCIPELHDGINTELFRVLLAKNGANETIIRFPRRDREIELQLQENNIIFQRFKNFFTPFNRDLNIEPIPRPRTIPPRLNATTTMNYGQSTHNKVVEESTKESIKLLSEKYQGQELNIADIYNTIAGHLLNDFCKKQKAMILADYKEHVNNSNNSDKKIPVSRKNVFYLVINSLLQMAVLPQKAAFFNYIMLVIEQWKIDENYNNCYNALLSLICQSSGFEFREDVLRFFFDPTEESNLETNGFVHQDNTILLNKWTNVLAASNITIPARRIVDKSRINVSILTFLYTMLNSLNNEDTNKQITLFKQQHGGRSPEKISVPVSENIRWCVIFATFLKLDYSAKLRYLSSENSSLFFYFWLELQEEGTKLSADVAGVLTDTLFDIGSTYTLDDNEKNITLALQTSRDMMICNGFLPSCAGGAANKFIEKLVSISSVVSINYVAAPLIQMRVQQLILDKSIEHLLSLPVSQRTLLLKTLKEMETQSNKNPNLSPPIEKIWPTIYPAIRDSIIDEFSKTNPGVECLIKGLPASASDRVKTNYHMFKGCLDNYEYMTFDLEKIQQTVDERLSSNVMLVIEAIVTQKVEEYRRRLVSSNQLLQAIDVWPVIKDGVIREMINQLQKEYPGIGALDSSAASSSRMPSNIEMNNAALFRSYITNKSISFVEKAINNPISEETMLGKRAAEGPADNEPPAKRPYGFFSPAEVKSESKTPPASPPSSPSHEVMTWFN